MPAPRYLLDANACIHLLNGTSPAVAAELARCAPSQIRISSVVTAELLYGARNSSRVAENLRAVASFLTPFVSIPFDDACADSYALIRAELRRRGELIGANDMFIAATALTHELTLVTHNTREFGRVPGLVMEDWEAGS